MLKVLVVDDYEGIRNMLNSLFKTLDCKVESAENAKEGLEKFTGKDVVFIDFAIPYGLAFIRELRNKNYLGKIVFMSSYEPEDMGIKKSDCDYYLQKGNFDLKDITKIIEEVKGHRENIYDR